MSIVNVLEAKTQLSKLIDAVESGQEREIIIARNGKAGRKADAFGEKAQDQAGAV